MADHAMAATLLEGPLLRMMRSAAEGHVPAAGFATMVLLQKVCHCDAQTPNMLPLHQRFSESVQRGLMPPAEWTHLSAEKRSSVLFWAKLDAATQHAIAPYLSLKAENTEAPRQVVSPIYLPSMRYSDWVVTWCRQLLGFTATLRDASPPLLSDAHQMSRANLLVALSACVRYDADLALSLLPPLLVFLLGASPAVTRAPAADDPNAPRGGHVLSRQQLLDSLLAEIHAVLLPMGSEHTLRREAAPAPWPGGYGAAGDGSSVGAAGGHAEHLLCCQALFTIFDTLSEWKTKHRRQRNEKQQMETISRLLDRIESLHLAEAALRAGDPCRALRYAEYLLDKDGLQAAHFHGPGMVARELHPEVAALMHAAYLRTEEPDGLSALARMRSHGELPTTELLAEEAHEHEAHGRFSAALNCYQIALQASSAERSARGADARNATVVGGAPRAGVGSAAADEALAPARDPGENRDPQRRGKGQAHEEKCGAGHAASTQLTWQLGICDSLRSLGLFVAMRDSAEAAFRNARGAYERSQLLPSVVQSAWRLGQWDDVRSLLGSCDGAHGAHAGSASSYHPTSAVPFLGSSSAMSMSTQLPSACDRSLMTNDGLFEIELAHAFVGAQESRMAAVRKHCSAARRALIPQIAAAGMDSYARAYSSLVKLHMLQELQSAANLLHVIRTQPAGAHAASQLPAMYTLEWRERLQLVADAPQFLEPILAVRIAIMHMAATTLKDGSGAETLRALTAQGLSQSWLRIAKSARAAGHYETATHALAQASVYDTHGASLIAAKMAWEGGRPHEALLRLQQERKSLDALLAATPPQQSKELTIGAAGVPAHEVAAAALLRLARYTEERVGDAEAHDVHKMYHDAVKRFSSSEAKHQAKAHYHYARFLDNSLARSLAIARRKEVPKIGPAGPTRSVLTKQTVSLADRQAKMMRAFLEQAPQVIRSYGQALRKGMRHAALALSRMLAVWLEYADLQKDVRGSGHGARQATGANAEAEDKPHAAMEALIQQVPNFQWLPEVAQLVSRSTHGNVRVRTLIHSLLANLLAAYPNQLAWSVVPAALSTVAERKRHGETIVTSARHKLMSAGAGSAGGGGSEILAVAKRVIDQLRKVSYDNSMDKRERHCRMSTRWSALYRMTSLPLVIPTHANLTAAPPLEGEAMRDYEPFSESSVTIERWEVKARGSNWNPEEQRSPNGREPGLLWQLTACS